VLPQEHGMVGMTRLLVMFPLGYLLSRLVIVHLDLFGEVSSSQLSRSFVLSDFSALFVLVLVAS
jgi:hypothetical protein